MTMNHVKGIPSLCMLQLISLEPEDYRTPTIGRHEQEFLDSSDTLGGATHFSENEKVFPRGNLGFFA